MEQKMQESRNLGNQLQPIQEEIENHADGSKELQDKVMRRPFCNTSN
jgi:hypothetical protein